MSTHPGQELKKIRESKGISLEQAAKDTCLRTDMLRSLEECSDVDALPEVYHKLSLRMYARYLGVTVTPTRSPRQANDGVSLSPVDGCVELAYSEKLREQPRPKRRYAGAGTIFGIAVLLILTTGLWSLNAKLSRLNFDERDIRIASASQAVAIEEHPAPAAAPAFAVADPVSLDESVHFTLCPAAPDAE